MAKEITLAEIENFARANGAKEATIRQWRSRGKVPDPWQIKLVKVSGGIVSLDVFPSLYKTERGQNQLSRFE